MERPMRAGEQARRLRAPAGDAGGFTYIGLLWWVAISGVMLAALGQQWRMEGRRERETEMVFRARQIQAAIRSYQAASTDVGNSLPERLEDLIEDRRGPKPRRHLRRLWNDPVSGKPWGELRAEGRIRGVYSNSDRIPLAAPDGIQNYREWHFDVEQDQSTEAAKAASRPLAVPKLHDLAPTPLWPDAPITRQR